MKLTAIFTAAVVALSSLVSAQTAIVNSKCPFNVYLQSFPYNGGKPNTFTTIKPGGIAYVEKLIQGGSTIKMSNKRDLASPLFFGYTYNSSSPTLYYSLDEKFGNPFINYRNKLIPSAANCQRFNCAPHKDSCYGRTLACASDVDLGVTLCQSTSK